MNSNLNNIKLNRYLPCIGILNSVVTSASLSSFNPNFWPKKKIKQNSKTWFTEKIQKFELVKIFQVSTIERINQYTTILFVKEITQRNNSGHLYCCMLKLIYLNC